jgi:elongation factor G
VVEVNLLTFLLKLNHKTDQEKTGLEFVNSIKGGNVPKEFIPSVEKGFKESMKTGVLAGFPVEAMKVDVESTVLSMLSIQMLYHLSLCAKMALQDSIEKMQPVLSRTYHEIRGCYSRRKHGRCRW